MTSMIKYNIIVSIIDTQRKYGLWRKWKIFWGMQLKDLLVSKKCQLTLLLHVIFLSDDVDLLAHCIYSSDFLVFDHTDNIDFQWVLFSIHIFNERFLIRGWLTAILKE